jgi:formylglycine-generating enzyme required for sulfatase activity
MAWAFLQSIATWTVRRRNLVSGLVGVAVQGAATLVPGGGLVGRVLSEVARYGVKRLLNPGEDIPDLKPTGQVFPTEELDQIDDCLRTLTTSQTDLLDQMEGILGPVLERHDEVVDAVKKLFGERDDLKQRFKAFEAQVKDMLKRLKRIEATLTATHEAALDIQATLNALGRLHLHNADEVRQLLQNILARLDQYGMRHGAVQPRHSFSIRSDQEKQAIKALLVRFRQLPATDQQRVPALLNGLGKLSNGTGQFGGAQALFLEVARSTPEPSAQAEAYYNAYRAALEAEKWDDALEAITQASTLDPRRFAPFPMKRFRPQRILGAGGFGAAFLCRDAWMKDLPVVVKPLHDADLAHSAGDVFQEAHVLKGIHHESVIAVHDSCYADVENETRPYIVMDYFDGVSLNEWLKRHGKLSLDNCLAIAVLIAEGMRRVHAAGILHRDLKPDNVLVKKEGGRWQVKIIDFGLALKQRTIIETSQAGGLGRKTILSAEVAGTLDYAPPEQLGKSSDPVKEYSDIYAFARLFYAMCFLTPRPDDDEREKTLPADLRSLLSRCTSDKVGKREPSFDKVVPILKACDAREQERQKREEAERQRRQQQRLGGEKELTELLREAFDRTHGQPTKEDADNIKQLCRDQDIPKDRAQEIVNSFREQWLKAHPPRRAPQAGEIEAVTLPGGVRMKFAYVPPSTFVMGSPTTEEKRGDDEKQHWVTISKGFYFGIHPVTRGQFRCFVEAEGYLTEAERGGGAYGWPSFEWKLDRKLGWKTPGFQQDDDHPVVCVSHNDAVAYCAWLSRVTGQTYGLPTEAQWEYACRGGPSDTTDTYPFYFKAPSRSLTSSQANFAGNYPYGGGAKGKDLQGTSKVGSYETNSLGLYDMHGNVWEWCRDWYGAYAVADRQKDALADSEGPAKGPGRVIRGGCWGSPGQFCRAAQRERYSPAIRFNSLGLRVARVPSGS